ncbi:MAG: aldo/keto reductase [Bdellovibrionota bacterium]
MNLQNFIYGTAWKGENTEKFTYQALKEGLCTIDTANQRRHYYEAGVGNALKKAFDEKLIKREDVFLQTKYTFVEGQDVDEYLPYNPNDSIVQQVHQSFTSSLAHLGVETIDSYVLHGPKLGFGITDDDVDAWETISSLKQDGKVKLIGVSNFSLEQLEELVAATNIYPQIVQNRCYPSIQWNSKVRHWCLESDIVYQGFNLQRDPLLYNSEFIRLLCQKYQVPINTLIYSFALQAGIQPLTGARDVKHLQENLRARNDLLEQQDFLTIEAVEF